MRCFSSSSTAGLPICSHRRYAATPKRTSRPAARSFTAEDPRGAACCCGGGAAGWEEGVGGARTSSSMAGANDCDCVGARGAAGDAPVPDPVPSSMRKFRPPSLIHSPVVSTLRQNSTASTPGSSTSWRAPKAGNGDWRAFSLYTTVPGGLSSGGRSCQSWDTADRITPQWRRSPSGALGSHWRLMVWTPWGLVLTVAMSCLPSGRGMPIMSVTSPRMAARTATAFRRERDGPTTGFDDPPLRDASRSAGSTTRRDQAVAPGWAARAPAPAFMASVRYGGPLTGFTRALWATRRACGGTTTAA
mmetsp:Transcript_9937/g.45393  ORF Transcript_9937/g.45393 Transcript_9937/m.45393 type:complete len:303 (-) Transcript_9937:13-921(-)